MLESDITSTGEWNRKQLLHNSRRAAFEKGKNAWIALVIVCAIFSFLGSANSWSTAFIHSIDSMLGLVPEEPLSNVNLMKEYILQDTWFAQFNSEFAVAILDSLSQEFTWLINLLAANAAYLARNVGEVWVTLLLTACISSIVHFFIQNALIVGKCRYVLEQRFQKRTLFRRAVAPYHRKYLLNIVWVMFRTNLQLSLWWLTIIGGFYKMYQYRMIPYILAENPSISFRNAMNCSKGMTRGCKWNMFLLDISLWYLCLLKALPVVGLLTALPYEAAKDVEVYLFLRKNYNKNGNEKFFVEEAFDASPVWESEQEFKGFLLPDIIAVEDERTKSAYHLKDFLLLFFLFSMIGWTWEVVLHLVQHQELVNRGSMYGPWLPIYGTGGILCIWLLDRYKENLLKTVIMIMLTSGILEFAVSWGLDYFINASYWNYDGMLANINGRICLAGLVVFAIGGSMAIYIVGPYVRNKIRQVPVKTTTIICNVLLVLFIVDLICCLLFGLNIGEGVGTIYH